ncbi:MAG TPA: hypothetical protein VGB94_01035 [Acidobacteriaceae bacterium]
MPLLTIHTDKALAHVLTDFTGLSYESSQLVHPNFSAATIPRWCSSSAHWELMAYFVWAAI